MQYLAVGTLYFVVMGLLLVGLLILLKVLRGRGQ